MGIGGFKIRDQFGLYFLTFTVVGWVDVFTRNQYKLMVIEQFKFYRNKGLKIHAYVIMTNHIHVICHASKDSSSLSNLIRDFKKRTAHEALELIMKIKEI